MKELEDILGKEYIKYNEPMSKHTTFKVGGPADIFAVVDSREKLIKMLELNEKFTVIGNGSNVLVKDSGIRGIVIKYTASDYEVNGNLVVASAGITNAKLANSLLEQELTGFEFAAGIPGTLGGALVMNAGAYGREIKDVVIEAEYIDLQTKELKKLKQEDLKFEYRKSTFTNMDCIILNATLKLDKGNKDEIQKKMQEYKNKRLSSQPLQMPNAGSSFKRGDGFITAKLIDEAGLKGYSIGGAEVSTKHAGFIVNKGNATARDILELIDYIKIKVYEKFDKNIEPEIKIMGE